MCLKWLILLVQFKWWGDDKIESLGMLKEFVYDDTDDTYFSNTSFHLVEMLPQWVIISRHCNKPGVGQTIQKVPF